MASLPTLPASEKDQFKIVAVIKQLVEHLNSGSAVTLPLPVSDGGTGQITEAEAIGELIQALTADTSPDYSADYLATYDASADTGKKVLASVLVREKLTAARTYYVRTDGSDSNTGLVNSAGGAFLTIQKAVDVAAALDSSIYDVTIQVVAGAYTATTALKSLLGPGLLSILGDTTTPANVTISTTSASCFTATNISGRFEIAGFSLTSTTSGYHISVNGSRALNVRIGNNTYNAAPAGHAHIFMSNATVTMTANYTIAAGITAGNHITCGEHSFLNYSGRTVTLSGTPGFSIFIVAANGTVVLAPGNTFTGGATGARFSVNNGALIDTAGAGASYFPGDSAGAGTNFGASPWGLYL